MPIIAAAVALLMHWVEVHPVLLGVGLLLASIVGKSRVVADTFALCMVFAMVTPIGAAMVFAALPGPIVCDHGLVLLLVAPLRRDRGVVLPVAILVADSVNLVVPGRSSPPRRQGRSWFP
jgi:hypothetical protein